MYWCRNEPGTHVWTLLGKLKHASSYLSAFAIPDDGVWGPCVFHKRTVLASLYIHMLRGLGLLTGTG